MNYLNKAIVTNNLTLKVISLIMGYTFWFVWSQTQTMSYRFEVPLCLYNVPEYAHIDAPETISVQLAGTLQDFYHLDISNLAAHIDGATLHEGNNQYSIHNEHLLMPESIKMLNAAPSHIQISYNMDPQEHMNA